MIKTIIGLIVIYSLAIFVYYCVPEQKADIPEVKTINFITPTPVDIQKELEDSSITLLNK